MPVVCPMKSERISLEFESIMEGEGGGSFA